MSVDRAKISGSIKGGIWEKLSWDALQKYFNLFIANNGGISIFGSAFPFWFVESIIKEWLVLNYKLLEVRYTVLPKIMIRILSV